MTANTKTDDSIDDTSTDNVPLTTRVADGILILGAASAVLTGVILDPFVGIVTACASTTIGVIVGKYIGTYVSG